MYKISIAAAALLFGAEALRTDRKFTKLVQIRARQGGEGKKEPPAECEGLTREECKELMEGEHPEGDHEHGSDHGSDHGDHGDHEFDEDFDICSLVQEGGEEGQILAAVKAHLKLMQPEEKKEKPEDEGEEMGHEGEEFTCEEY